MAYSSPELTMVAFLYLTVPLLEPVASRAMTRSSDDWSATSPKTTWRPLSHEVTTVVTKNCEPLLMGCQLCVLHDTGRWYSRVGTSVGHGQQTRLVVLQLEVLIGELLTVDGLSTGALHSLSAWSHVVTAVWHCQVKRTLPRVKSPPWSMNSGIILWKDESL